MCFFFFFKQKTAYEMRISDWSSDVCSSDLDHFVNRGDNGDANDTNAIIAEIVKLRADRAKLLGFESHAHWRMQDTMAGAPAEAQELMMRVWPAAVARVNEEVADQQAIADKLGHDITIEPWDYRSHQEQSEERRVGKQGVSSFKT